MVAFYALAVGLAGALVALPWVLYSAASVTNVWIIAGCVAGAATILRGAFAPPPRFSPPGPRLTPETDPRIMGLVAEVARDAGHPVPREVYLVGDTTAWVALRGGYMGIGGRPVLAIGYPLLGVLSLRELRAVLAHEFGHFTAGDTRLGPFIYRTRVAISNTLAAFDREKLLQQLAFAVFNAYGRMFLRVSHGISRAQEYAADQAAARLAGETALIGALWKLRYAGPAFDMLLQRYCQPVLQANKWPPLMDGFCSFVEAPRAGPELREGAFQSVLAETPDPLDTHPTLLQRIAALGIDVRADSVRELFLASESVAEEERALQLVDVAECEGALHEFIAQGKLAPFTWDDLAGEFIIPEWRMLVTQYPLRAPLDAGDIPALVAAMKEDPDALARLTGTSDVPDTVVEDWRRLAELVLGAHVGLALLALADTPGVVVKVSARPGALTCVEVTTETGMVRIHPSELVEVLRSESLSASGWHEITAITGLAAITSADAGRMSPARGTASAQALPP